MRLRLSIQRHALPITKILFTTRASSLPISTEPTHLPTTPTPSTAITSASAQTVAQLLAEINDVVPLEAEDADWGLEDYVVEVNGYECLHYQLVEAILREGDEVTVRALERGERSERRTSGRWQISSDGRHLVDGVAWGKPRKLAMNRPPVNIPTRGWKRRKIGDGQMLLLGNVNGLDDEEEEDQDEEDDLDYDDAELDIDESDAESDDFSFQAKSGKSPRQLIARQVFDNTDADSEEEEHDDVEHKDRDADAYEEDASDELQLLAELRDLQDEDERLGNQMNEYDQEVSLASQSRGHVVATRSRRKRTHEEMDREFETSEDDSDVESAFVGFSSPTSLPRRGERAAGIPVESDITSPADSNTYIEEAERTTSQKRDTGLLAIDCAEDSENSEDYSSDSESTSSSELSDELSSDSDSNSTMEKEDKDSSSPSTSSSSSSPEASTDSESVTKPIPKVKHTTESPTHTSGTPISSIITSIANGHGQGSARTHQGNGRAKKRKRLSRLKSQGLLPPEANFADLAAYESLNPTEELLSAPSATNVGDELQAKKQELLNQVVDEPSSRELNSIDCAEVSRPANLSQGDGSTSGTLEDQQQALPSPLPSISNLTTGSHNLEFGSEKRRSRLDLASSRNLIFGSLGVRTPKTAAAEQALRERFSRPVKGGVPTQDVGSSKTVDIEAQAEMLEDEDVWRAKLTVSAVECELEDVHLQPPPFPFVQNWDKDAVRRYRKSKKVLRNQSHYYEYDDEDSGTREGQGSDRIFQEALMSHHGNQSGWATTILSMGANAIIDDTTSLPRPNFNNYSSLSQEGALRGAVIAYKELQMSPTTYQPGISDYRVARIERSKADGGLELCLSVRDRLKPDKVQYDEETGQPILGKFDIFHAADAEDGDAFDEGRQEIQFDNLIEPRILIPSLISSPPAVTQADENIPTISESAASMQSPIVAKSSGFPSLANPTSPSEETTDQGATKSADGRPGRATDSQSLVGADEIVEEPVPHRQRQSNSAVGPVETRADEPESVAFDTSGFESPRYHGSGSNLDNPSENAHVSEGVYDGSWQSTLESLNGGEENILLQNGVAYPITPNAEHTGVNDAVMNIEPHRSGPESPPAPDDVDATEYHEGDLAHGNDIVEETNLNSLPSIVLQASEGVPESEGSPAGFAGNDQSFLGGLSGHASSDDDLELPALKEITSTAVSGYVSPPSRRKARKQKTDPRHSDDIEASASHALIKQSQTQISLSQIPGDSQIVDLTLSSPVSASGSNGYGSQGRSLRSSTSWVTKEGSLTAGLGERRLLKSKKVKV